MILYHYRPIESALLEIEKGTFHFASREELNDPIEGYVRIFWKGDKAAWEGLFRNYICSLKQAIDIYLLNGDEEMLHHRTLLVDLHCFDNVPEGGILKALGDGFLADQEIQKLSAFYGNHCLKVCEEELLIVLHFIHNRALIRCIQNARETGIVPKEAADEFVSSFASKKISFPDELLRAELIDEKQRASIAKVAKGMIEDIQELRYVKMGFEDKLFLFGEQNREDGQPSDEKKTAEAHQRRKWLSVAVDFPGLYVEQLKEMVYPESYIVCFSSQYNDSSMWGNYADHHKGVCLIYETDENNGITLDMKNASCRHEVLPVRYGGDTMERNFFEAFGRLNPRQIRTWLTGLDGISSAYDAFSDEDEWRKRYWEVFQVKTYQKNPAWEHEREYRIAVENFFGEFKEPASRNLRYTPEHLKGVIFGLKTAEYDKKRVMEKLLARADKYKDIKFYQAEYADEKQSISIRRKSFWKLN